jgi:hypothetical protein
MDMRWRQWHQPLTISDLVVVLGVPRRELERCLRESGILPAYRVGQTRCYARCQLDAIEDAVGRPSRRLRSTVG